MIAAKTTTGELLWRQVKSSKQHRHYLEVWLVCTQSKSDWHFRILKAVKFSGIRLPSASNISLMRWQIWKPYNLPELRTFLSNYLVCCRSPLTSLFSAYDSMNVLSYVSIDILARNKCSLLTYLLISSVCSGRLASTRTALALELLLLSLPFTINFKVRLLSR